MNLQLILKAVGHAALGGFAAGVSVVAAGGAGPLTTKTALTTGIVSAITSVVSLFSQVPTQK